MITKMRTKPSRKCINDVGGGGRMKDLMEANQLTQTMHTTTHPGRRMFELGHPVLMNGDQDLSGLDVKLTD